MNWFIYVLITLIVMIVVAIVFFFLKSYFVDEKDVSEIELFPRKKNSFILDAEDNIASEHQKELLLKIIKDRLRQLKESQKVIDGKNSITCLNIDEMDILFKYISNIDKISDWNNLTTVINDDKAYGMINEIILYKCYELLKNKDIREEMIRILYLMDVINGGVYKKNNQYISFPEDLDINATVMKLLNNAGKSKKKKFNIQSINKASIDIVENGGILKLKEGAKIVISTIIFDILADSIFHSDNIDKKLSDVNRIYLRILVSVLSGMEYNNFLLTV